MTYIYTYVFGGDFHHCVTCVNDWLPFFFEIHNENQLARFSFEKADLELFKQFFNTLNNC